MKKNNKVTSLCLSFVLILIVLSSCTQKIEKLPSHVEATRVFLNSQASLLTAQHNIHICGIGEGYTKEDKIREISLDFQVMHKVSKETARRIIVDCFQQFQTNLNNCYDLQAYFPEDNTSNINIKISLVPTINKEIIEPDLCIISFENGILKYFVNTANGKFSLKESETFEEALANLNN